VLTINKLKSTELSEDSYSSPLINTNILSVSQLNQLARQVLESSIPLFWVSGEISNLTRASSGHWYFSLKDAQAQVRCVMFRGRNQLVDWQPQEGDHVEARALVTLYEARGDFQLNIEQLQRAGAGTLFEAFEQLKAKLQQLGLFDPERKRAIPAFPRQIGVVTSPDAAALQDVLSTLKRRMPNIPVLLYPTPVQGKGVAAQIAAAIQLADQRQECDVLIICRGGGSMEDLWQFNEEIVAHAIANCRIPTISGVGHETDFTICDFVADMRAATPTAAAELASPDRLMLLQQLQQASMRLQRVMQHQLSQKTQTLDFLARRLISPQQQLALQQQQCQQLQQRLGLLMQQQLQRQQQRLLAISNSLHHLNPQAVLQRGYALAQNSAGEIVHSSQQLKSGEHLQLKFAEGGAQVTVQQITQTDN
jgi:exodeoxyribonuclease VII large subunit